MPAAMVAKRELVDQDEAAGDAVRLVGVDGERGGGAQRHDADVVLAQLVGVAITRAR